jgi:hypothetical protein
LLPAQLTVVGFGRPKDGRRLDLGHDGGIEVTQPLLSVERPLRRLRLLGRVRVNTCVSREKKRETPSIIKEASAPEP